MTTSGHFFPFSFFYSLHTFLFFKSSNQIFISFFILRYNIYVSVWKRFSIYFLFDIKKAT